MPGGHDHYSHYYFLERFALVVFNLVLALGVAFNIYQEHALTDTYERERLLTQSHVIGENLNRQMESANLAMIEVRNNLPQWAGMADGWQQASRLLTALTNSAAGVRTMSIYDPSGTVVASNRSEIIGKNFNFRDYFRAVKFHPDPDRLYISPPFKTVLGIYALNLSRMIVGSRGEFAGIVSTTLDPQYFISLIESVRYMPDMRASIIHADGLVFFITPENHDLLGKQVAKPNTVFPRQQVRGQDVTISRGSIAGPGENRLLVRRTVNPEHLHMDRPLTVATSRDLDVVFALWRQSAIIQGGLLLLVALSSVLGLVYYQRRRKAFYQLAAAHRMILDGAGEGIIGLDASGVMTFLNPAAERQLGWSLDDATGRHYSCLSGTEGAVGGGDGQDVIGKTLLDGVARRVEEGCFVRRDGSAFPVDFFVSQTTGEGTSAGAVLMFRDVTERRQAEETLRRSEQRLQDILNNTSAVVFMKDLQGIYLFVNRMFEELFHVSNSTIHDKSDFDIFPSAMAQAFQANDRLALASQTPIMAEEIVPQDDGLHTYLSIKFALQGADGLPYAVCGIATDITERKKMEEALRAAKTQADAANQAKSDFLAVMSHEIRTPLNVLIGMGDVLLESELSEEQQSCVSRMQKAGNNLLDLINQILDFSRIEAGRLHLVEEPVQLVSLLDEVMTLLLVLAQGKGLELKREVADNVPAWILSDMTRLRQVLFNLLGNAIKFTEQGGIVLRAALDEQEQWLHLTLEDTGIGISDEQMRCLFQPFTQADSSITRRFGGSGLGLSLSHRLVELMGGRIRVESRLGVGTVFHVELPLRRVAEPIRLVVPKVPADPVEAVAGLRILLVEDAVDNQMLIVAFLRKTVYHLDIVDNGAIAVEKIQSGAYDLVFMDVQMPVMDGYTATRLIRQWEQESGRKPLPIIALTAHALEGEAQRSRDAGCDLFLTKPIKKNHLLEVIQQMGARTV